MAEVPILTKNIFESPLGHSESTNGRGWRNGANVAADALALKQAGWSDEAIYDAVTVCALFNFYNRWIDATGVHDMPAAAYALTGERLKEFGYFRKA